MRHTMSDVDWTKMSIRRALWLAFGTLLAIIGFYFLRACAIEKPSWLGVSYCLVPLDGQEVRRQTEAGRALREQIAELERQIAARPFCQPPAPAPRKDAGPLKIDPAQKDLSGLEGCWVSTAPTIINSRTNEALQVVYCFDAGGRTGKMKMNEEGGQSCIGPITARLVNRQLIFESTGAVCPDGNNYPATRVNCRVDASRSARCDIVEYRSGFGNAPEPIADQIVDTQFLRQQ